MQKYLARERAGKPPPVSSTYTGKNYHKLKTYSGNRFEGGSVWHLARGNSGYLRCIKFGDVFCLLVLVASNLSNTALTRTS